MNQSINTDSKNIKEPQQKYRLGTVSIKILGGLKPCSPKRPENVKITTLYRHAGLHFRAATRHVNNFARIQYV